MKMRRPGNRSRIMESIATPFLLVSVSAHLAYRPLNGGLEEKVKNQRRGVRISRRQKE